MVGGEKMNVIKVKCPACGRWMQADLSESNVVVCVDCKHEFKVKRGA